MIQRQKRLWGALVATAALCLPATAEAQLLLSETSARFDWAPASGAVEFYDVYVSRSSRHGQYELEQTVTSPSAVIDGSEPGEVLRVRVRAGNTRGYGPISNASEPVRFGLSSQLPGEGSPGVVVGRTSGEDSGLVFYANPETGDVWRFWRAAPDQETLIANEPDPDWQLVTSGDFDGDGTPDLLWIHADGASRIWYLDAQGYEEQAGPAHPGVDWSAELTADLDGNGQDDVLWRGPTGRMLVWFRIEADFAATPFPAMSPDVWEALAAGDFDGDGLDDVLWRDVTTSDTLIWSTAYDPYNGIYARTRKHGKRALYWQVLETRDADGDGGDDVNWQLRESPDVTQWWQMDGENALRP